MAATLQLQRALPRAKWGAKGQRKGKRIAPVKRHYPKGLRGHCSSVGHTHTVRRCGVGGRCKMVLEPWFPLCRLAVACLMSGMGADIGVGRAEGSVRVQPTPRHTHSLVDGATGPGQRARVPLLLAAKWNRSTLFSIHPTFSHSVNRKSEDNNLMIVTARKRAQ